LPPLLMAIAIVNVWSWNRLTVSTDQALSGLPSWRRAVRDGGKGRPLRNRFRPRSVLGAAVARAVVSVAWVNPQALPEEGEEREHEQFRYPSPAHRQ